MRKLFFLIAFVILLFLFVLFIVFSPQRKNALTNSPTPASGFPSTTSFPEAQSQDFSLTPSQKTEQHKAFLVSELINFTPKKGVNFTFDYDFNNAMFVLTLSKNGAQEGDREFDDFLKEHGVQRSWIPNLRTENQ